MDLRVLLETEFIIHRRRRRRMTLVQNSQLKKLLEKYADEKRR